MWAGSISFGRHGGFIGQVCASYNILLNSKWLNASALKQLARGLGTPSYATISDLRTLWKWVRIRSD